MAKRSFPEWMEAVDNTMVDEAGVDSRDLPDWDYMDSWDSGDSPKKAAKYALQVAGWDSTY
jgi:hypothetical protein